MLLVHDFDRPSPSVTGVVGGSCSMRNWTPRVSLGHHPILVDSEQGLSFVWMRMYSFQFIYVEVD